MRLFCLIAVSLLLWGCALNNLDSNYVLQDTKTEGIVLIGMDGPYKPVVFGGELANYTKSPGDIPDDRFNEYQSVEFDIGPVDGYVITDMSTKFSDVVTDSSGAPHQHAHAISRIANAGKSLGFWRSCENLVPVFTVQPGVINYIGDYTFDQTKGWLSQDVVYDQDKAMSFIKANYPGLANLSVVAQHVKFMRTNMSDCGP